MLHKLAFIRPTRAVIYADISQKAPIGYLPQGKAIKVGSRPMYNSTILPVVVKGKLAYIKIDDLLLVKDYEYQDTRELQTKGVLKQYLYHEKFKSKKNVGFTFSSFQAGQDWRALSKLLNQTDSNPFGMAFHAYYEQHPLFHRNLKAQVGLSFFNIDDNGMSLKGKGFHAKLLYTVLSQEYLFIDLLAAYYHYPGSNMNIRQIDKSLDVYGTEFAIQVTRHFNKPFGIRASLAYQTLSVANLDDLDLGLVDGYESLAFKDFSINGFHIGIGAFFRF